MQKRGIEDMHFGNITLLHVAGHEEGEQNQQLDPCIDKDGAEKKQPGQIAKAKAKDNHGKNRQYHEIGLHEGGDHLEKIDRHIYGKSVCEQGGEKP